MSYNDSIESIAESLAKYVAEGNAAKASIAIDALRVLAEIRNTEVYHVTGQPMEIPSYD